MKIQVVRVDGGVEVINLVGTVTAHEPGKELEYPRNQSPLHVEATGADYFFREDGRYDGWGMSLGENSKVTWEEAKQIATAIEADREVLPPLSGFDGRKDFQK